MKVDDQFLGFTASNPMRSRSIFKDLTVGAHISSLASNFIRIVGRWEKVTEIVIRRSSYATRTHKLLLPDTGTTKHSPHSRESYMSKQALWSLGSISERCCEECEGCAGHCNSA